MKSPRQQSAAHILRLSIAFVLRLSNRLPWVFGLFDEINLQTLYSGNMFI